MAGQGIRQAGMGRQEPHPQGPPRPRGRATPPRRPHRATRRAPSRSGGFAVNTAASIGVIIAVTAVGAIVDGLLGGPPGIILYTSLVLGTVVAGLLVQARMVWVLIPIPALVFPFMAVAAGVIGVKHATVSQNKLATLAAHWLGDGFIAMATATLLAVLVTVVRMAGRRN